MAGPGTAPTPVPQPKALPAQMIRREGGGYTAYGAPGYPNGVNLDHVNIQLTPTSPVYDHNDGVTPHRPIYDMYHDKTMPKALAAHLPPPPVTPATALPVPQTSGAQAVQPAPRPAAQTPPTGPGTGFAAMPGVG